MAKRFDIYVPRPGKDGKTFWKNIGTAWQNDKGIQLVFDALPLPDAEGRCVANLFEPREGTGRSASNDRADARGRANSRDSFDDDGSIPF